MIGVSRHRTIPAPAAGIAAVVLALSWLIASCTISDSATTTTQTTAAPDTGLPDLVLDGSGLGDLPFGLDVDTVIDGISSVAGGFDRDSEWIPPDSIYGRCPGEAVRAVGWGSLLALFTSSDGSGTDGRFFAYTYGFDDDLGTIGDDPYELGLETSAGIGLGSSRTELRAAHAGRVDEQGDADLDLWTFAIGRDPVELRGQLDGPGDDARVVFIASAPGCESRSQ